MVARTRRSVALVPLVVAACTGAGGPASAQDGKVDAAPVLAAPAQLDFCAAVIDRTVACATPEEKQLLLELRELATTACREQTDRDPEEVRAELECVSKPDCDEFRACEAAGSERRQATRIKQEVEVALQTGENFDDALASCKYSEIKDPEVLGLCGDLYERGLERATRELEGIRDVGGDGLGKCFDLQATAERVSPGAKATADALCKEVEAGRRAKEAIDEATRSLEAGVLEVPPWCGMAIEELRPLSSEWARNRLQEVARACYVDLGAKILAARVGTMSSCEYQVEQVYDAVKRLDLAGPELDRWIARAGRKCQGPPR